MKKYITSFIFVIMSMHIMYSQDTLTVWYDSDWNEINEAKNAVYYRKAYQENDMWVVRDYYISHKIQMKGVYKSKKMKIKQGRFIYYYENGNISSEGDYSNGKLSGFWTYRNENGMKRSEGEFINDKRDGEWSFWDEFGKLKSHENYKNGTLISAEGFHKNGIIKYEGGYLGGIQHGLWTYYNSYGRITLKGNYSFGIRNGKWTKFFKDGKMEVYYNKGYSDKQYGGIIRNE